MEERTDIWNAYESGLAYQSKINLLPTADKNERFYSGDQWGGLKVNKFPLVVLNVIKRIVDFKISTVMSDMVTMQFSADGIADDTEDEQEQLYRQAAATMSDYSRTLWETLKLDTMNEDGLLNAILSGDMISFWFWNDASNDISGELIDNVNFFPGDPNLDEINNIYGPVQPYILLSFRRQVKDVKTEAKRNNKKLKPEDLLLISADDETNNQAGDRAKTELDPEKDAGKCIILLKLWGEQDNSGQWHIMAKKSTRSVIIRDTWDTGLHRYPVAMMNWNKRKGSTYGDPDVTYMIPNQIEINRTAGMIALWIRKHGFPKVTYDKTRIPAWDNDISTAIGVNGDITGAAQYMQPGQISAAVMRFMEWFIQTTKEMAGANESVLGEMSPTNTSAILVNQEATTVPLGTNRRRFYRYIEDIGLIWLDFWLSKYGEYENGRMLTIKNKDGTASVMPFDAKQLQNVRFKLKIDVGPSTQWSQVAANKALDNLLTQDYITFVEYLKRLPKNSIPDIQGLIEARDNNGDKDLLYELMARYIESLPPEQKQQLMSLPPEQLEEAVKALIMQGEQQPRAAQSTQSVQQPQTRPYMNNVQKEGVA